MGMAVSSKISVVFSFRNEEEVLPELIRRVRAVLCKEKAEGTISDYDLIFVNDASLDRSREILMEAAKGHTDIRIVNMSARFGVAPCVLAGMAHSLSDAIVYMDADLQDPPEVIPELIKTWRDTRADVVHTVRLSRAGESRIKLAITKLGYWILQRVSDIDLPIDAGDFKLLSRRVVDHLLQIKEKKPYLRGLVCYIGFNQTKVYYHREGRFSGKTKRSVFSWTVAKYFFHSALISFSTAPLQLALLTGVFSALIGFIVLGQTLIARFLGYTIPGWTAIMVAVLFLGSIQLLSTAVLGFYISSIFLEVKKRPSYIIESTFGFDNNHAPFPPND